MPGLPYNGNGVKDLINAVQGYQVRQFTNFKVAPKLTNALYFHISFCSTLVFCSDLFFLLWVCIVRYS